MIRAVIFDLDGTLYRGEQAIEGAAVVLKQLRNSGVKVLFISNAGTATRAEAAKKLRRLGIAANPDEIYNTSYGTARYIAEKFGRGTTFYAVAEPGFMEEMKAAGHVFTEKKPRVAIASLDRQATYDKIAKAYLAIKAGAVFIATNKDEEYPVEKGFLPGAGAIVAAVENATGAIPILIGKPESCLIDYALQDNKLGKAEALLVGDSLRTDIAAAKKARIKSALVLTGITTKGQLEKERKLKPDMVMDSLARLPTLLSIIP